MDVVSIERLSKEHLKEYWSIMAYVPNGDFCREVWHSLRLLPFSSANGPTTRIPMLYVPVQELNDAGIKPLVDKLRQIDPAADHRIMHTVLGD